MPYAVYILKCSDGSYYTGLTKDLDGRLHEHQTGVHADSYTLLRNGPSSTFHSDQDGINP